jgi:aspartate/tyrosine/aromatic aminotransferase
MQLRFLLSAMNDTVRYLPIGGLRDFVNESVKLAYGNDSPVVRGNLVAAVQSLSGTGSCRLFADFQVTCNLRLLVATALLIQPRPQGCCVGIIHLMPVLS